MRKTLGEIGSTRVLLLKTERDPLYRWIVVTSPDDISKNEPIWVDFKLGLVTNNLISFGVALTAELARQAAITALVEDHQQEISGHEKMSLMSKKWQKLSERERRQIRIGNHFPPIEIGECLLARNILFY